MAGRYKAYPEYKDSGVEWVGQMPEHWELLPARSVVSHIVNKNIDGKVTNYLSLIANVGVIRYEEKGDVGNKKPDDLTKCKIVKKGQLVINSMNYSIGSYGMSPYDGICSPVYIILEPKSDIFVGRYSLRTFENSSFQKHLATFGNGILEHRAAINWDHIKGQNIPIPPIWEQNSIAIFLDDEIAKIDMLISKQQTLISLLKEKRQSMISHFVTQGLNREVPMKSLGSWWDIKVPQHWETMQNRYLINNITQGWSPLADNTPPSIEQVGVTKLSSVKSGQFLQGECKTLHEAVNEMKVVRIQNGDFLLTRANTPDLVGDVCVVTNLKHKNIILCDLIYKINYSHLVNKKFYSYFFQSSLGRFQIRLDARGTSMSMAKISQFHIKSWIVVLPPKLEQDEIVRYLDLNLEKLDKLENKAADAINILKERNTALISAAVTGNIDVRHYKASQNISHEQMELSS